MKSFKQFLTEKKSSTIYFIDIDETLFKTFSKINVVDTNGEVIKSLTNNEFNGYVLQNGESFNFDEFTDSDMFDKTSIPIDEILELVKKQINDGNHIVLLTARKNFDSNKNVKTTFRRFGININKKGVYIELSGNLKRGTIMDKKEYIINKYINTGRYDTIFVVDDHVPNLKMVTNLIVKHTDIKFTTIYVKNGKISRVK